MIDERVIELAKQGKIITDNKKITYKELYDLNSEGKVEFNDFYQRDYCWTKRQEIDFVHSVLNVPFWIPKVLIIHDTDGKYYVSDGQHRVSSIINRVLNNDKFEYKSRDLSDITDFYGVKYGGIKWNEFKSKIMDTGIDCCLITNIGCTDTEMKSVKTFMFTKWNNGTSINNAEKRASIISHLNEKIISKLKNDLDTKEKKNLIKGESIVGGKFNNFVEILWWHYSKSDIGDPQNDDDKESLHSKEITDNKASDFINLVKCTVNVLNKFKKAKRHLMLEKTCQRDLIVYCIGLYKNKVLKNLSCYESYLAEILDHFHSVYVITKKFGKGKNSSYDWRKQGVPKKLDMAKYRPYFEDFEYYYGTAQTSVLNFTKRKKFLDDHRETFGKIDDIDTRRQFSIIQKLEMYEKQNRKCVGIENKKCSYTKGVVDLVDLEGDHIKEHSTGGKTDISNGQLLCKSCHKEKTKRFVSKVVES